MKLLPLAALMLAGCAAAPISEPPPSSAPPTASASPAVIPSAVASAVSSSPASTPEAPPATADQPPGTPLSLDLDTKDLPAEPCTFSGIYRGSIGETALTVKLSQTGNRLTGLAHYDLQGPAIALTGTSQNETLDLAESGGAHFKGTCDKATGKLTGTYQSSKGKQAFVLAPRLPGGVGLYQVAEQSRVKTPISPECAQLGKTTEMQTVNGKICLPTDPAALAQVHQNTGMGACDVRFQSLRVFGLENNATEKLVNSQLTHDHAGYNTAELRAAVRKCPVGNETSLSGVYAIVHDANDVLSVFLYGSVNNTAAAHGAMWGPEPIVLDLKTGRRLVIGDIITSEPAFREAILACETDTSNFKPELTWGTPDSGRKTPRWTIVPGGIAVVVGDVSPIMYGAAGMGPIASFASLAGRGLLRSDSPVARLWAGVVPAGNDAPFCSADLGNREIVKRSGGVRQLLHNLRGQRGSG